METNTAVAAKPVTIKTIELKKGIEVRLDKAQRIIVKCEEGWINSNLSVKDLQSKVFGSIKYDSKAPSFTAADGTLYFKGTACLNNLSIED